MYGLVGVTQTVHVLPIALAFFGVMVCFAGWCALMIRSQQRERRTTHPLIPKESNAVVVKQPARSAARAWLRARLVVLGFADLQVSDPYLLPTPYAVAEHGPVVTVNALGEPDGARGMLGKQLRQAA
jgi:hypothetical protein